MWYRNTDFWFADMENMFSETVKVIFAIKIHFPYCLNFLAYKIEITSAFQLVGL